MTLLAAIDVGTNTVRLLVASSDLVAVERAQRITRLGKGVDAAGVLDAASMDRTLEAIASFVERARELGAERIRIAGTSALRDAANREEFVDAVWKATALDLEILNGADEGRCAYRGATSWLGSGSYVVCDIGGGSTELITNSDEVSVDIGSVRVWERFVRSDPPTREEIEAAREVVVDVLTAAVRPLRRRAEDQLVGVAGTITTLAALIGGLDAYDHERVHGSRVSTDDVSRWADRLNAITVAEVRELACVESGRADVLGAGALICVEVMHAVGASEMIVSERDILDGLVMEFVG